MSSFKTRIKEERLKICMTQDDLAKAVQVRRETIIYLEQGKYVPSLKLALRISSVFNKNIEDIFEFTEDQLWREEV
jgi:putative transcriptional regulator